MSADPDHRASDEETPQGRGPASARPGGGAGDDFADSFTIRANDDRRQRGEQPAQTVQAEAEDDPFATVVIKADLTASHRGYGYDEEESTFEEPLPDDLERAAEPLILERDPDECLEPIRPAFETADDHLASLSQLEIDFSASGWSQEAAIPWVGDQASWDGAHSHSGQAALDSGSNAGDLARGANRSAPAAAARDELADSLSLSELPPAPGQPMPHGATTETGVRWLGDASTVESLPLNRGHVSASGSEDGDSAEFATTAGDTTVDPLLPEETRQPARALKPKGAPSPPPSAPSGGAKTVRRDRRERTNRTVDAGTTVNLHRPSRPSQAVGAPPQTPPPSRVSLPSLPPLHPEGQHAIDAGDALPHGAPAETDEMLRSFEHLQRETTRLLDTVTQVLAGDLFKAIDPATSTESQLLYDAAALAGQLADRTTRLHREAEQFGIRYRFLRQTHMRMHSAVRQAKVCQTQMLSKPPQDLEGLEIGVLYKPAEHVSGDFYDFVPLDDRRLRWGITLGDISGHGIAAALIGAMAKKLLHVFLHQGADPADTLRRTNAYLFNDLPGGTFLTALVGIFDLEADTFTYARAGHPAPVLYNPERSREPSLLHVGGMALGMAEPAVFDHAVQQESVALRDGDTVVLFSDGAFELSNKQQQRFGMKRFLDMLRDFGHGSAGYLLRKVHSNIQRFRAGSPQDDDLTVLVVKIRPDTGSASRRGSASEADTQADA